MSNTPTADEINKAMELMGLDYIQARNHLIGREIARQRAQDLSAAALARALGPEMPKRIEPSDTDLQRALGA